MARILIVDDELPVLCGLSRALHELCNFFGEVRTVVNGREAVYEVSNCFYNVCFLDIRLPDISGLTVLKDIKDISPETDIILMSASPASHEVKQLINSKTAYYINKPFNFERIKHLMKLTLDRTDHICKKESFFEDKDKRKYIRSPLSQAISFYVKGINVMELGGAVDISYEGICIETYYPLTRGDIILFKKGVSHERGIVIWSAQKDNYNYRGGIKFI